MARPGLANFVASLRSFGVQRNIRAVGWARRLATARLWHATLAALATALDRSVATLFGPVAFGFGPSVRLQLFAQLAQLASVVANSGTQRAIIGAQWPERLPTGLWQRRDGGAVGAAVGHGVSRGSACDGHDGVGHLQLRATPCDPIIERLSNT